MEVSMKCGAINLGQGFSDICVLAETGDLVVIDDYAGNCVIGEVSVTDASEFESNEAIASICDQLQCDGAVLSAKYLITFKVAENKAQFRPVLDPMTVEREVEFDLNESVELDEDEDQ